MPFYGAAIVCLDDENVQRILPPISRRAITYGTAAQARYTVSKIPAAATWPATSGFASAMQDLGAFYLPVPGMHNVLNATAAIAVALELDIPPEQIREAPRGLQRRRPALPAARRSAGITVVDDYGHHPTEIRATLAAARLCGFRRIHVLFQPHRYTRTMHLMDEFARSFHQADSVYLLDIYAASEKPIEGVTAQSLAERLASFGHNSVNYCGTIDAAVAAVKDAAVAGDAVLTLGAGNVWQAGDRLLTEWKGKS